MGQFISSSPSEQSFCLSQTYLKNENLYEFFEVSQENESADCISEYLN